MDKRPNLYEIPVDLDQLEVTVPCGGNLGGSLESCVEIAQIPGTDDTFVVLDSKPGGPGRELRFTGDELDAFAEGWMRTRGK